MAQRTGAGAPSVYLKEMISPVATLVRRHDPDRFLTALFAPEPLRETLFVLYAFNHELARAREVASSPILTLIRLQWWREVVEGATRQHEVALPLARAVKGGALDRSTLLGMIGSREFEAEDTMTTLADWRDYLLTGAGSMAVAAASLLGASPESLAEVRLLGAAYGAAGTLRSISVLSRQGRCLLPEDVLAAQGLDPHNVIDNPHAPGMQAARAILAEEGNAFLRAGQGVRLPRPALAAILPAVLARRDLACLSGERHAARQDLDVLQRTGRRLGDRVAVILAALRGRV